MELIEKVYPEDGKLIIPYEKYRLENGLTLILHFDDSAPVAHVDVTYHVGSANEVPSKTGLAHFFEHMMFQGSQNVKKEEHFKVISEVGGVLNGSTSRDRTNYYQTVPNNSLETVLWLESDRMGFLKKGITFENFENQRDTIINERLQRYDNAPYGLWREFLGRGLYPDAHPYSWLTIGSIDHIKNTSIEDFIQFYDQWYGPNNAVLTIGGDIDRAKTLEWVDKYFGEIPAKPLAKNDLVSVDRPGSEKYFSYVDNKAHFPALLVNYLTVPKFHPDEVVLDCMSSILGKNKTSKMYKYFVQKKKAIQASAFHYSYEHAGELTFFVLPFAGLELPAIQNELNELLVSILDEGFTDMEVRRYISSYESRMYKNVENVHQKVSLLAHYATFADSTNYLQTDYDRHLALNKETLNAAFQKYILNQKGITISVLDKKETTPAAINNFELEESIGAALNLNYSQQKVPEPISEFDRSLRPPSGASPVIKVPEIVHGVRKDGQYMHSVDGKSPVAHLHLYFKGGHRLENKKDVPLGAGLFVASTFLEGYNGKSAETISNELQLLGSGITASQGETNMGISLFSLSKNYEQTVAVFKDCLENSDLSEESFEKIKKQQLEAISANRKRPSSLAGMLFNSSIFDSSKIEHHSVDGTRETVEALTLEEVNKLKHKFFHNHYELVSISDRKAEEIVNPLGFLDQLTPPESVKNILASSIQKRASTIYLLDIPDSKQSEIRIGHETALLFDPLGDYFKAQLANYNFGGAFNSRLNHKVREEKGFTYGIRSGFNSNENSGRFLISTSVDTPNTVEAITDILTELSFYLEQGITEEELTFMKNAFLQKEALRFASKGQKAVFLKNMLRFQLGSDYPLQQKAIIQDMTTDDVMEAMQKHVDKAHLAIVVVGDAKVLQKPLEQLRLPIQLVTQPDF